MPLPPHFCGAKEDSCITGGSIGKRNLLSPLPPQQIQPHSTDLPRNKILQLTETFNLTALVAVVPKDKLTIKGTTKSWAGKGSSGKAVHRIFCPECGSPIAHDPDAAPEIIAIKAGTLDVETKKALKPDTEIWTQSKLPFMTESLAKPFKGMPE